MISSTDFARVCSASLPHLRTLEASREWISSWHRVVCAMRRLRFRFPAAITDFSSHQDVQTSCGVHQVWYVMGCGDCFPECKATGIWDWPPSSISLRGFDVSNIILKWFLGWKNILKRGELYLHSPYMPVWYVQGNNIKLMRHLLTLNCWLIFYCS